MSKEIERLGLEDYEDCLHFLKMSFNEYDHWVDFDKELPKAFRPKQDLMEQNYVLRNGREIVALVGIYPMNLVVDGRIITCATVGNVATHPNERGKGYMQTLFTEAMHEVDRRGIHMTRLGGLRQRYNRYGYEYAGLGCKYIWNNRNSDAYTQEYELSKYTFVPLESKDSEFAKAAFELYTNTRCNVDRIDVETFLCVLRAHSMEPFAAVDENGIFAGYVTVSPDKKIINEQYSVDENHIADLTINWLKEFELNEAEVYFKAWDEANIIISKYAEDCVALCPSMFRVNDWQNVIEPFLRLKNRRAPLPEGRVVLATDSQTFAMTVEEGKVSCVKTDEKADICVDHLTATRLIFGMQPPEMVVNVSPELYAKLNSWLPLPLSWSRQDNV